jgi:TonB family protein
VDPKHPLTFHYQFYPPKSISAGAEGTSFVVLFVDTDGQINAVQLLTSTGYPRLDIAGILSVENERMLPATINGRPMNGFTAARKTNVLHVLFSRPRLDPLKDEPADREHYPRNR